MALPGSRETFQFGDFVLDVAAYDLRRNGHRVRLERQPMDLLILLIGRRGELVSRSQIVDALWGKDVFVDVENGVNTAIRKLRRVLRDSPDAPTFIETVPGRGYRFIATVEVLPDVVPSPPTPADAAHPSCLASRRCLPRLRLPQPGRQWRFGRQEPASVLQRGARARALSWESSRWRRWPWRSSGGGSGRLIHGHA